MSVRRHSDHRPSRGPEGRSRPPVRQECVPVVSHPGPEEGGGHRSSRAERNRQDHVRDNAERRDRAEPRPLSSEETALGRRARILQRDRGARLSRENREQGTDHRDQAAVRRQTEQDLFGEGAGSPPQDRSPGKARRTDRLSRARIFMDRDIAQLSGGELQRLAIAATMLKDADVYFFDEPSSYLDIYQRLRVAKVIQSLSKEKYVVVVEHDLAVLDFLADTGFLMYGKEGAYCIIAQPR